MTLKPVLLILALGLESNNRKVTCRNRTFTWAVVVFGMGIAKGLCFESHSADEEATSEKACSVVSL